MNLFKEDDIRYVNNTKITKNKEILLNIVANKGGWKNLTNTKITKDKKMFYIQGEVSKFLETSLDCSLEAWEKWLDKKCKDNYGKSLNEICKILGNRLYSYLSDPSQLPTLEKAKKLKSKRVGVDTEDREIIKNSVKHYKITKEDCKKWVYRLIVHRNYYGGIAQHRIKNIIEKQLKDLRIDAIVELSKAKDDIKGIDLIVKKDDKKLMFQIKRDTFNKYQCIKNHYTKSYPNNINYIIYDYDDKEEFKICNLEEVIQIIRKVFMNR